MAMEFDDKICNTGLGLGIGLSLGCLVKQENFSQSENHQEKKKLVLRNDHFFPSLTLAPSHETYQSAKSTDQSIEFHQQTSSLSAGSSKVSDEDEEGSPRKKLRLSKEQSQVLEDSFKEHSTLNPKQKQALAQRLNLKPRQVEVWFQNRRARTKLKQTEVDCESLKKCCETLTEENKRLQKELQELKSLKIKASYYMQLPAATLAVCPSCERIAGGVEPPSPASPFMIGQKYPHFFNPFTHPSAAC